MSDFDVSPYSVGRFAGRWFLTALAGLLVIGLLILVGWQAGWWFRNQNINREAHLIRNSYANQQTLRDQIVAQLENVDTLTSQIAATQDKNLISALTAQRAAVAGIVCQDASEVTGDPLPAGQAQWVTVNCSAGVVRPGSAYYQVGAP